jgi:CRISPR-associated endonuclease/helicase Cas3
MLRQTARWPGKSADDRGVRHSAILHMLDVAVVAEILAPALSGPLRAAFVLFAALHDLGKINRAFRVMLDTGQPQGHGAHWEVTEALLEHFDERIGQRLGSDEMARFELYAASAGHHGRPSVKDWQRTRGRPSRNYRAMIDAAGPEAVQDAAAVLDAFLAFWPEAHLGSLPQREAQRLSWRLNGLITAADWIGSNPDWFPAQAAADDLPAYLAQARTRASEAVRAAGLNVAAPSADPPFPFVPRPMQEACASVCLPDGPMLALIEDETGSGKSEAALMLAQRMLTCGKATGLYLALPTMATADAMFARVAPILPRLFPDGPSLTLAHGRAALSEPFRDLKQARALNPDDPGPTDWLADSRRRALLAQVGVGTIDQALMAVVRAKHACLRQFGLSRSILIVDEVHEMGDPYMGRLLEMLLHLHAAQGGSAVLMSATLDLGLRDRLVSAFETGAGRAAVPMPSRAYPALSLPGVVAPAVPANASARGAVRIERLETAEQSLFLLEGAAAKGAACVWVRNAVDVALVAVAALRERGVPADLLHARFTLHDRKRHETKALEKYGKNRYFRPGRVLVATQVVESSLDLDFDVMVSDLAPMASLIQRAGRLWRHMDRRPAHRRPVPGPTLHVMSPDPAQLESDRWAAGVLGQGAHVYPLPLIWRTAQALFAVGEIRAPDGLRDLVEAAHAEAPLPAVLERAGIKATGEHLAARSHAGQNIIGFADGYRTGASGAGDRDFPTRLGQPQEVLVLMRDAAPWSGGGWSLEAAQLSEVSASAARLGRLPLPESAPPAGLPDWLVSSRRFVAVGEGGAICEGLRYDAELGLLFLSSHVRG